MNNTMSWMIRETVDFPDFETRSIDLKPRQRTDGADVKITTWNCAWNETSDSLLRNDYAAWRAGFQKIAARRSRVSRGSSSKTTPTKKKWPPSVPGRMFTCRDRRLRTGTGKVNYGQLLDAQRIHEEGCPAEVNKRGDPCTAGKVAMNVKNKPSSSAPPPVLCTLARWKASFAQRKKERKRENQSPVCPVRNSLSIVYNAEPVNADVPYKSVARSRERVGTLQTLLKYRYRVFFYRQTARMGKRKASPKFLRWANSVCSDSFQAVAHTTWVVEWSRNWASCGFPSTIFVN